MLTDNDLAKLGNVEGIPNKKDAITFVNNNSNIKDHVKDAQIIEIHKFVKQYLDNDEIQYWMEYISSNTIK